ncbi:MFS transporter [Arthrobacter sp. zg-Y859]|uniref:MFS transporter n=1 Tax=Arthrobacter jinronghuae TaxID=2964609 RepID=A0ABT1NRP6_9MICC|nr:MFS transporter [Arthrobacter jinronghuae]MCQ1950407.1 MFS transporter [Arthrobacter jinronghuae]MCQ1956437.1 MFS transporter [Arthrobacter jinronghuae]UWX77382.1 MFS transporter [Arthrobacter jinronghuae]
MTATPAHIAKADKTASWGGVVSLGLGIFAIVMSEFLPASLLPRIAGSLDVSVGAAGQSVTMTAVAAVFSALFIAVVLPRTDRRRVMISLTALAILSNVLVALAPGLFVLLSARLLLGVALGGFWAMATAMAAHLVPADHLGRALTVINAGVAVATIVAVPLGAWLGEIWGWRAVFFIAAIVAALALLVQAATLPAVRPTGVSGLRALGSTLRSGVVVVGLVAVLLVFGGHFGGFTYIRPAAETVSGIDAGGLAVLLLVFGAASVLGTLLSGPLADRALRAAVFLFPAVLGLGMLVMLLAGESITGLFTGAALWGFGFGGIPTAVLSWGARTVPTRLEQIGGLIVTVCNIAIAVGASVGGVLVDGAGATYALTVGGIAAIVGALILTSLPRTKRQWSQPVNAPRSNQF